MASTVKVVIDVASESVSFATDKTLTLTQQVRLLKKELEKLPEGSKEWTVLQKSFNDTKDNLDRVNVKSKELFGTMSSLPGPIGQVSGQLDNTVGILKTFSSLKFSDIKTQFVELGKDIGGIGKNIANATGLTKVYETTLSALTKTTGAATLSTRLLAGAVGALYAALGVGLILLLVEAGKAIYNLIDPTERQTKALQQQITALGELAKIYDEYNDATNLNYKLFAERLKTQKAGEEELAQLEKERIQTLIVNAFQEAKDFEIRKAAADAFLKKKGGDLEKLTEKEKEYYNNVTKLAQEAKDKARNLDIELLIAEQKILQVKNDAAEKAAQKTAERIAKEKQIRDAALKEIGDNEKAAVLELLPEREKELRLIVDKYKKQIDLAVKYKQDTTALEEAMRQELLDKREKYNGEDIDAFEKKLADDLKRIEDANKAKQEAEESGLKLKYTQGILNEDEYQIKLYESKTKYATSDKERQDAEIELLEYANGKKKESADITEEVNKKVAQSYLDLADNLAGTFTTISGLFTKGSDLAKAFAIIGVLLNAASAIGKVRLATLEATADFAKAQASGVSYGLMGAAMIPINPIQGAALIASGTAATTAATAGLAAAKIAGVVQTATIGVTSAAQIAAILSVGKDSKTVSSGGSSGGGQAATPSFNGTVNVPAPVIGASQATQSGNLGQTIVGAVEAGNSRNRPIQAYVIGGQVTTQQQLDRRIAVAAKMGG